MTKILEINRGEDFIRFNFNVTVEESTGLVIVANVCGSVDKGNLDVYGKPIIFCCVDAIDWEETTLFGKKLNWSAFVKMYEKLFEEGFETMEKRVDDAIEKAVFTYFPNEVSHFSKKKIKKLAESRLATLKPLDMKTSLYSDTDAVYCDWELNRLLSVINYDSEKFHFQYNAETEEFKKGIRHGYSIKTLRTILVLKS